MIKYAVIGAGWRAEFYLRIANLLPEIFSVSAVFVRNPEKAKEIKEKYKANVVTTLEQMLKSDFDFIVNCVNKTNIVPTINQLCEKGYAVLSETPVTENINPDYRVQVAEQFHFQPRNMAIKSVIDSGIIGEVTGVKISACHDYHAGSLIRFFLGTKNETPKSQTINLPDRVMRYNCRAGLITPELVENTQKITVFEFKNKTAIYDFTFEQYFSDIRATQITVRGTHGEIVNDKVTYLKDGVPHTFKLTRNAFGINENLDGFSLFSITGNGETLYQNPFPNVRFSDEEIAIATCLLKMDTYLKKGEEFYPVSDAVLDSEMFGL